jgi:thiamine kinase-like enzyme
LPGAVVRRDHSWELGARTVLEVADSGARFIVKAGAPEDHHIGREITAHEQWLGPWRSAGRAPELVHADRARRLLVTSYLPGELVLDHPAQDDPDTYAQAGELLALLHGQLSTTDPDDEARQNARAVAWLDGEHRIGPDVEERLRDELSSWPEPPSVLVPTHGDWQPRNWVIHRGRVSLIDFGRAALRPAMSDFGRLAAQDFARNPRLEEAFLAGYGSDPREPEAWHRIRVREAIATAAWAYRVGDACFEAQGHRMIAEALGIPTPKPL